MNWLKCKIRLKAVIAILFRKIDHWVILSVDKENLVKLLKENEDYHISMLYHGMQPYIMFKIIQLAAKGKDEMDMVLEKAKFEAQAEEFTITKKHK